MKLIDFVNINIRKPVDFDGRYGAQCVDLFRQYAADVCGVEEKMEGVVGAKDLFLNWDSMQREKKYFARITSSNGGIPGDAAVWNATAGNPFGHVAIVLSSNQTDLLVFEQDGLAKPGTSNYGAKLAWRSRKGLLGFLRRYE